jgi:hypothetical protein
MVHWSIILAKDVANLNGWVLKCHILAKKQISTMDVPPMVGKCKLKWPTFYHKFKLYRVL